ncbi:MULTISPECIES: MaoC family dehydratase [Hydrogenophilus]|jgi:3-hydroxybutyryl-CoA dehydratase|uniref:Dehydratase n=1 Tax=Hydrogenophilus thermoluteolus TaxID=297 RepID=A0A2Z6DWK7_HYDTE|nr:MULTISPECIES: MaoC family dehydratase [Hydrogenophilus]MBW7657339.1 MaoC family dehydratase [Hydrogenophilus thermoluteolus]BBD76833.1 dehydratase [Hydrogenophilus thermoluteolus]GLW60806.1 3-hydroxybutyryl-CoA dehydratase [Hydrogenophilus thermoluteolus]HNQ49401.1 MaoC family dehydratase [Hydrogenophilus thermoluteolus]HNU20310.1 MaoC family dehydratase [Hydrogenophilus thermoluteolus]
MARNFAATLGYDIADLQPGMVAEIGRTVSEADILAFAGVSGDTNPVHLDAEFAAQTQFKERIAHGMLSAAFISAVLGTKLPGPGAIYLSQSLRFRAPVHVGDTVVARVTVKEVVPEKRRVVLETLCLVGETVVVEGEATIYIPPRQG